MTYEVVKMFVSEKSAMQKFLDGELTIPGLTLAQEAALRDVLQERFFEKGTIMFGLNGDW